MKKFEIPLKHEDGYQPRGIMFTRAECLIWGGHGVCDFCNEEIHTKKHPYGYMIEPLGSNGICQKCYDEYIKRNKVYEEDRFNYDYDIIEYYYNHFNLE